MFVSSGLDKIPRTISNTFYLPPIPNSRHIKKICIIKPVVNCSSLRQIRTSIN